jgi:Uma2 family endonuclease
MIANKILTTEDRVEFLDGYLVKKMPQNSPHASTVIRMDYIFKQILLAPYLVRSQVPVTLGDSEPEPDLAVVKGDLRTYDKRHPRASEVHLIVEVADSSLTLDREVKGPIYARAGIPEYWIVNIAEAQIEVYTQPQSNEYGSRKNYSITDSIPLTLNGVSVGMRSVAELLP